METRVIAAAMEGSSKQVDRVSAAVNNTLDRLVISDNGKSNEEVFSNTRELVVEEQVIRWERFLPRRFLRVLLVENDDSTRHIVTALLRKCNYQVAAVADGLKAWAVLKKKHYKFDLVLTEVVMPSLSGVGLLSKIMSNEICKSIPVIMMSSHDSIGIVFKCMLKGAADFLVKPVRKNELRNLWQHVWRKYCSGSSGDGSENGKPNKTKLEMDSDNEVASNYRCENAGIRFKAVDSSDQGSRTQILGQSSYRNSEMEKGRKQKLQMPLRNDNRICSEGTDPELRKHDCNIDVVATIPEKEKAIEKVTMVTPSIHELVSTENFWGKTGSRDGSLHRVEDPNSMRSKECENIDPKLLDQNDGTNKLPKEVLEFLGAAITTQCSNGDVKYNNQPQDILHSSEKSSDKRRTMCSFGNSTLWDLSLGRPQVNKEEDVFQAKHVLNHSIASAFSRYRTERSNFAFPRTGSSSAAPSSKTNEHGDLNRDICASADNGRRVTFSLIERSTSSHEGETLMNYQPSSGCDKEDEDPSGSVLPRETSCLDISANKDICPRPQLGVVPFSIPVGAIPFHGKVAGFGNTMQPLLYPDPSSIPHFGSFEGQKDVFVFPSNPSSHSSSHLINNALNWSSRLYVGNHHSHQVMQGMVHPPTDGKADLGGNSNLPTTIVSGSNCIYDKISVASNNRPAQESGNEDGFVNCNGKGMDSDRSRREAALTKFRLKRKDRCFEKKVRYQNRKKLAEQRPRLKGQFVRQAVNDQPL